ncbi:MAG TPA: hypothetical protein PKY73_00570, partial [Hyphomonas sp.]|nr:hypothetical protein [Hyphomonas sp.]
MKRERQSISHWLLLSTVLATPLAVWAATPPADSGASRIWQNLAPQLLRQNEEDTPDFKILVPVAAPSAAVSARPGPCRGAVKGSAGYGEFLKLNTGFRQLSD